MGKPLAWKLILLTVTAANLFGSTIHPLNDGDVPGSFNLGGVGQAVRGWRFLVNDDINVLELGGSTPHERGDTFSIVLWQVAGQVLLAQRDFISDGTNNWQWAALDSPVALSSGSEYIVAMFTTSANYYFGTISNPGPWAPTGTVQYLDMRFANGASVNTFPTNVLTNYQYGVPDIGYELASASAPEPGTVTMFGLGLGAVLFVSRRRQVAS